MRNSHQVSACHPGSMRGQVLEVIRDPRFELVLEVVVVELIDHIECSPGFRSAPETGIRLSELVVPMGKGPEFTLGGEAEKACGCNDHVFIAFEFVVDLHDAQECAAAQFHIAATGIEGVVEEGERAFMRFAVRFVRGTEK